MKPLPPTDLAFFDAAPLRITATLHLKAAPARVFDAFADPASWPRWWPMMTRAAWTTGTGGVGAEREVALRLFGRFLERIVAWEPGKRFAFTMIGTTSPMAAQMAEDYRLAPDAGGTRLDWVMAAQPTTLGKLATPALRVILGSMIRRGAVALDRQLTTN